MDLELSPRRRRTPRRPPNDEVATAPATRSSAPLPGSRGLLSGDLTGLETTEGSVPGALRDEAATGSPIGPVPGGAPPGPSGLQGQGDGDSSPTATRVVVIDGNVLDQVNRGNADAAAVLRRLRAAAHTVYISHETHWEIVDANPDPVRRAAYRAMLDDLGIREAPRHGGTLDGPVESHHRTIGSGAFSDEEVLSVDQASARGQGLTNAPESTGSALVSGDWDYALGRQALGLPPITIAADGTVTRTRIVDTPLDGVAQSTRASFDPIDAITMNSADRRETAADVTADALLDAMGASMTLPLRSEPSGSSDGVRGEDAGTPRRLPERLLASLERGLGADLSAVRLHTGPAGAERAHRGDADAVTEGAEISFASGRFQPDTRAGQHLIAHEAVHVIQAMAVPGLGPQTQRRKARTSRREITRISLYVDRNLVVLELDHAATVVLPATWNGHPSPGTYQVKGTTAQPKLDGVANSEGYVAAWTQPPNTDWVKANQYTFDVIPGLPGPAGRNGVGGGGQGREGKDENDGGNGKGAGDKGTDGTGAKGRGSDAGLDGTSQDGQGGGAETTKDTVRLTPEEEAIWRQMAELMGVSPESQADPAELVHLFQVLREFVINPEFGSEGESWVRFARFLEQNRERIKGHFQTAPQGRVTTEVLEKIIAEYGEFVAAEPDVGRPDRLRSVDDFDREFRYDPGWAKLSPEDRKLLLEYAKASPESFTEGKVDFTRVTTEMKMMMALRVANTSFLGQVGEAARNAFTDPTFLITLIVVTGIYVGLWLTPDPSWVTKLLAGTLTVVLLAQFAIEDIYGFAVAWSDFIDDCARATTIGALQSAGDRLLKRIGRVGFDIMLFIVMWRVGKLAGPKLSKIGAERGVARAQARVASIEAEPGSGAKVAAPGGAADPLASAKAAATDGTPTSILDALVKLLKDPAALEGLKQFRQRVGDGNALKALESESAKRIGTGDAARPQDIGKFLADKGVTPVQAQAVKARLNRAKLDLARAKLIEAEVIKDPQVRRAAREEQYRAIEQVLKEAGILENPSVRQAIGERSPAALVRALRATLAQMGEKIGNAGRQLPTNETQGALGESLQRVALTVKYAKVKGMKILSNLALAERFGTGRTIAEAKAALEQQVARENPGMPEADRAQLVAKTVAKLLVLDGKVYVALGEIDNMVTEPGRIQGTSRPLEVSESKTGARDAPKDAKAQVDRVLDLLGQVRDAQKQGRVSPIRVLKLSGKKTVTGDVTGSLDLTGPRDIAGSTYGPLGRGFTANFEFTDTELSGVAGSIIRNLPPDKPATVPPLTSPKDDE